MYCHLTPRHRTKQYNTEGDSRSTFLIYSNRLSLFVWTTSSAPPSSRSKASRSFLRSHGLPHCARSRNSIARTTRATPSPSTTATTTPSSQYPSLGRRASLTTTTPTPTSPAFASGARKYALPRSLVFCFTLLERLTAGCGTSTRLSWRGRFRPLQDPHRWHYSSRRRQNCRL